jgi:hypothetical protein
MRGAIPPLPIHLHGVLLHKRKGNFAFYKKIPSYAGGPCVANEPCKVVRYEVHINLHTYFVRNGGVMEILRVNLRGPHPLSVPQQRCPIKSMRVLTW